MMNDARTRLSDPEFGCMVQLLQRYVSSDMDQWELWRLPLGADTAYVEIRRSPSPGYDPAIYNDVSRFVDGA